MNDVQAFIDRQLGFCTRLSYDSVLKRLEVAPEDSFYGLQNSGGESSLEQDSPIFACRFAEAAGYEHILALANEDGRVAIQDTSKVRANTTLEGFQCHNNAVFDLAWRPGHMSFVTVSGDHTAALWQLTPHGAARTGLCAAHARSVKTAAFRRGAAPVLATGARDGHVLVWDLRTPPQPQQQVVCFKPDNSLWSCHAAGAPAPRTPGSAQRRRAPGPDRPTSITGLVFQDENTLISSGECDGSIKVWDLRKNYSACRRAPLPRHCLPYAGASARTGYSNLLVDSAGVRLYASCMDGVIYCFNVATYAPAPQQRYAGHESGTFYIKAALSDDDRYLVSGSSDKHAYLWSVTRSRPLVRLAGHAAEVTCAAWRAAAAGGDLALVTCSDDARHNIWRVGAAPDTAGHEERGHAAAGWTEPAPHTDLLALLHTPVSAKRRKPDTPGSAAKRARAGAAPRSKRCLADMLNAAARGETPAKKTRVEASEKENQSSGVNRRDETVQFEAGPSEKEKQCSGVKRHRDETGIHATPPKRSPPRTPPRTPPHTPATARVTPTRSLPDYVASGEAPHLRLMSPARRRPPPRHDWLTALARARRPDSAAAVGPGGAASPAVPASLAPPRPPRSPARPRTLLSYFTPATAPAGKEK